MTFTPQKDLAQHVRFIAMYDDGSQDVFAIAQSTLDQGPGAAGIARIIAGEWRRDGYLKPAKIVGVWWRPAREFVLS
jgi:hypothetical protein